ncbi:MAG TPA: proline--tRNA ligase [Candidatus Aminicenantes bacterium]|nr:proline--tRNA ligase [Candidatus Aminicenantes bacterium]
MKQSKALIQTLREVPRDADVISQQLMIRAGMIQKLAAGIYDYLPLAYRSIKKFEAIVREELERDGCQELLMPAVQPAELWQESTRWSFYGKELLRFQDRKGADFCLGPTHEEIITDIVRRNIKSYKQLPINLFQIQGKFRDEIRPRFGLMRGREFIMKDGYSFHVDDACADREYWKMFEAYKRIFGRLGVKFRPVEADSGAIGGSFTHEFHVLAGSGEDAILSCDSCEYTSNIEKTEAPKLPYPHGDETELPLRAAHFQTPGIIAMEEQAKAFKDESHNGLPLTHASKFYLYRATKGGETWDLGLILRSDHEPNEVKLRNLLGADALELVPLEEAEALAGCKSGFIGPVELKVPIYGDRSLEGAFNLTCGANKTDFHHFGFLPSRDLSDFKGFFDLRKAAEGDICPRCGKGHFQAFRGIEVGQVFKLGTKYSLSMGCNYLDQEGKEHPMIMGCYGIGITRTVAAVIEQNYDDDGIVWPWPVAPYQVHLLNLDPGNGEVMELSNRLEKELEEAGFEVLHDDREGMSPGVKFKDADLLGFPLRLTVGARGLKEGTVELRDRRTKETLKVAPATVLERVAAAKERIMTALCQAGGR